jgi:predicted RNA binding protein YcfA (HicA-like mRNA interferase family)
MRVYGNRAMKVRELIRLLERNGWELDRTQGDHRQFVHSEVRGVVTVAGNLGRDIPPGTLNAILKAAGLKGEVQ